MVQQACMCCKQLPLWVDGVTRKAVGAEWYADTSWQIVVNDRVLQARYLCSSEKYVYGMFYNSFDGGILAKWKVGRPGGAILQTDYFDSPIYEESYIVNSGNQSASIILDDQGEDSVLNIVQVVQNVLGDETEDRYAASWDVKTGEWIIPPSEITSITINGVEHHPSTGSHYLNFAVSPNSNHIYIQTTKNGTYVPTVGTYEVEALTATTCRIAVTRILHQPQEGAQPVFINTDTPVLTCKIGYVDGELYYYDRSAQNISSATGYSLWRSKLIKLPQLNIGQGGGPTVYSGFVAASIRWNYIGFSWVDGNIVTQYPPSGQEQIPIGDNRIGFISPGVSRVFRYSRTTQTGNSNFLTWDLETPDSAIFTCPVMLIGKWCLNLYMSLSAITGMFGSSLGFSEDDTDENDKIDMTNYALSVRSSSITPQKRVIWNTGVVEPDAQTLIRQDAYEATSPFRHIIFTGHDTSSVHINSVYSRSYQLAVGAETILRHWHYPLVTANAVFELWFIEGFSSSGPPAIHPIESPLTYDMITVLNSGTVTHDPLEESDILEVDANGKYRITVRNVSGGESGGLLSIGLRIDEEIYGKIGAYDYSKFPVRIPAIYQEFYDVLPEFNDAN